MLDADRSWTALESEEALETIQDLFKKIEGTVEAHTRCAEDDTMERVGVHSKHLHNKLTMSIATLVDRKSVV